MTYSKPILNGSSAITAIQSLSDKQFRINEPSPNMNTQPAYEADE